MVVKKQLHHVLTDYLLFHLQKQISMQDVWKPILLTGPTEFPVAAPAATNTPDYIAQINEIKTWQANLQAMKKNCKILECRSRITME